LLLYETDSHAKDHHYSVKECPKHEQINLDNIVRNEPILTTQNNIFTSVTYPAWYNEEFCQSFGLQSKYTMIFPNTSNSSSINMA
jgi:hypothetical protein